MNPALLDAEQVVDAPPVRTNCASVLMCSRRGAGSPIAKKSAMRAGPAVSTAQCVARNAASWMLWRDHHECLAGLATDAQHLEVHLLGASAHRARPTARPSAPTSGCGSTRVQSPRVAACRPRAHTAACRRSRSDPPCRAAHARVCTAALRGRPRMSAGNSTFSTTVRHFSSNGCWNTMPTSRPGPNPEPSAPPICSSPPSCECSPASTFNNVDLPQSGRADQGHHVAGRDVHRHVRHREGILRASCDRPCAAAACGSNFKTCAVLMRASG